MPDLIYNVKFFIEDDQMQGSVAAVERYEQQLEEAKIQIQQLRAQIKGAEEDNENLGNSFAATGGSATRMNASFSTANQALFSMSDGLQDATQFSQGFSTGMRAIGNNVGFTVELLANLSRRVDEYNEANKQAIASGEAQAKTVKGELAQSFRGAAGALIFLNIAVAAFTIASQAAERRVKKFREEAKELTDVIVEVNSEFAEINGTIPDPFGFRQRTVELGLLKDAFGETSETIEKDFLTAINAAQGASGNLAANLATTFAQLSITRNFSIALSEAIGTMSKETFVSIAAFQELAIEIEKQEKVQEAFTKFINQEGNEAIKQYVETARLLSFEVARQAANAELSTKFQIGLLSSMKSTIELMDDLKGQIETQADVVERLIISEGGLTEEVIKQLGVLTSLQELYAAVNDPIESARQQIDKMNDSIAAQGGGFAAIDVQLSNNLELLDQLRAKYPELAMEIDLAREAQELFAQAQKTAVGADAVAQVAQAANQFGQIFGASKEFSIAMAIIDGGAAIVKTFAQLGFPAGIPAALAVAAQTAATINKMKDVERGSSEPIGAGGSSGGGAGYGISVTDVGGSLLTATPRGMQPSYEPPSQMQVPIINIVNEVSVDDEAIFIMSRSGEAKIASKQI